MHIEPRVVNRAKIGTSYLTGATAITIGLEMLIQLMLPKLFDARLISIKG